MNDHEHVFAAIRTSVDGDERALVIFNFSDRTQHVVIQLPGQSIGKMRNYLSGEVITLTSSSFETKVYRYGYKLFKILKIS